MAMQLLTKPLHGTTSEKNAREHGRSARRACRRWLQSENVIGFGVGERLTMGRKTGELALRVHVSKKLPASRLGIEKIPPVMRLPGIAKPVLVDVIEGALGKAQLAFVGDGIHLADSNVYGTIGFVAARDNSPDLFAVTCSHVLDGTSGTSVEWAEFPPSPAPTNPIIGTLTGFRSNLTLGPDYPNTTDIVLTRLTPSSVSPVVRWLGPIKGIRTTPLAKDEVVRLCGYGTSRHSSSAHGDCQGQVLEPHSNQTILIEGHGEVGFRDLVMCTRFTADMDSGAGVLDSDNRLVGIHMAAAPEWSAFQPISTVFDSFGLSLPQGMISVPQTAPEAHAAGATEGRAPPAVSDTATAIDILARTVWGEARGEVPDGRVGVVNVILNRIAKDKPSRFGATVEAVCRKKAQFSCWNPDDPNLQKLLAVTDSDPDYRDCLDVARDAVGGHLSDNTLGSDHYHAQGVHPSWADGREPAVTIGRHVFYNNIP
jgi:N-acetylmuramoyl-L-alanine amidase